MNNKTIITAAVTGAWPTKTMTPAVPVTPKEIAEDVYECYEAGAGIAHLHMRDDQGNGTMDINKFRETVILIKEKCDILLNLTTSGDLNATDETRMQHLIELKPELASYDCGSMNWMHSGLFINHPVFLEKLGKVMKENGVKPEIEIFDAGMFYNSLYYIKKGVISEPAYYQFVLGAAGGTEATVENLVYLKNLLPQGTEWSAVGIGKAHLPILMTTVAMGGNVRVGLEDNIYYSKGVLAKSNAEFVYRAKRIIKEAGRDVANVDEAKEKLNINTNKKAV